MIKKLFLVNYFKQYFSQEKQLNQYLLEVQHLKSKISELQLQNSAAKERIEVEKSLNRKLLSENTKLKDEVKATKEEVAKNYKQVNKHELYTKFLASFSINL